MGEVGLGGRGKQKRRGDLLAKGKGEGAENEKGLKREEEPIHDGKGKKVRGKEREVRRKRVRRGRETKWERIAKGKG